MTAMDIAFGISNRLIETLINAGAKVSSDDLHLRIYMSDNFKNLTKVLVKNGANLSQTINTMSNGEHPHTLMELAIDKDDIEMIEFLLENGDDVNR